MRLFIILSFCLCSLNALAQSNLPASVKQALQQAQINPEALGLIVVPASGGATVLEAQAHTPFIPASTMKLVTSLVALEELGPNFRWKTQFLSTSPVKKGVLQGDLYLQGGGEPNLTLEKFASMLRALRQSGIQKINGDLVLDRSYFDPLRLDLGAAQFDEYPDAYYNVIPDALLIHSNITHLSLESDAQKISAQLNTPLSKTRIANHLNLSNANCADWEKNWQAPSVEEANKKLLNIVLTGNFPHSCKANLYLNILDRNQYIARAFAQLWQELGGTWTGSVRADKTPTEARVLHERNSETLADTLRIVNKKSDNAMARILLLTLGAEQTGTGTTLEKAEQRVRAWLLKQGITDTSLVLENGSGLSRVERFSPAFMAALLQRGFASPWNAEFLSSLAIAGMDGTMRRRTLGQNAALRARIKTGGLNNVAAIAGYVRDMQDKNWIVVAIVNQEQASKARPALDALLNWLANGQIE